VPIGFWPTSLPQAVYANRSADASGRQVCLLSKVSPDSALGWPSRFLAQLYILTASAATVSKGLQAVAATLSLRLQLLHASTEADFDAAFATAAQLRVAALVIGSADPLFGSHAAQLGALALRHSVPAIYFLREFAAAGGLMSYGGSLTETYRLAGLYAGRILKGEKPADLPEEGPKMRAGAITFELCSLATV
jgi:ABC-type uncharacterized transport system substrate-binding protein